MGHVERSMLSPPPPPPPLHTVHYEVGYASEVRDSAKWRGGVVALPYVQHMGWPLSAAQKQTLERSNVPPTIGLEAKGHGLLAPTKYEPDGGALRAQQKGSDLSCTRA